MLYIINQARTTGGKAGKGRNKTSTIRVLEDNRILKQFRFKVGDFSNRDVAIRKAVSFIDNVKAPAKGEED